MFSTTSCDPKSNDELTKQVHTLKQRVDVLESALKYVLNNPHVCSSAPSFIPSPQSSLFGNSGSMSNPFTQNATPSVFFTAFAPPPNFGAYTRNGVSSLFGTQSPNSLFGSSPATQDFSTMFGSTMPPK